MSLCHCALDGKAMDEDAEKVQLRLEAMRMGDWGRGEVEGGGLDKSSAFQPIVWGWCYLSLSSHKEMLER